MKISHKGDIISHHIEGINDFFPASFYEKHALQTIILGQIVHWEKQQRETTYFPPNYPKKLNSYLELQSCHGMIVWKLRSGNAKT